MNRENGLNLKATELRLGLPGTDECEDKNNKQTSKRNSLDKSIDHDTAPAPKAQIVGWPPVRSYRRSNMKTETKSGIYVKVSMDGAPYLRKIDLNVYKGYSELLKALETMFKLTIGDYSERDGFKGSEYATAYEDKDGDWMLVGDVPWDMFMSSCKRLRIMKGSEARGLGCGV
ncbi:auxin-induced protein 22b [Phtheirospermum japonicum]|uniref:Auxin-responsive protein n=1 Tax=Phtheirospermum japonicum TaxID=374723 RepID=A0A830BK71_9LAMI|nr:auxin-induced protein 22b [Phtheirospermum japonicum]